MLFFCYFILSFCFRVICKSLRKIRKSSLIFGGSQVSLCVNGQTADHYFWCSRVFLAVLRVLGALWNVPGCSGGCSGLYRHPTPTRLSHELIERKIKCGIEFPEFEYCVLRLKSGSLKQIMKSILQSGNNQLHFFLILWGYVRRG